MRSLFFILFYITSSAAYGQSTSGDCSPIVNHSTNVVITCSLGPTDSQIVTDIASRFLNNYLKFLNYSFSAIEDEAGYSGAIRRNPDGSIDFDSIRSAPAYGTTKTTVAEFLFGSPEVSYRYASKIDEMIAEAAREGEPLPFDAVIFAQDIPQSVSVGEPTKTGPRTAAVCAWTFTPADQKCDLIVTAEKEGSTWKITDILNNDELSWGFTSEQVVCNNKSETTNVRSGPSAEKYPVIDELGNGTIVQVKGSDFSVYPHYYYQIEYENPDSNAMKSGYIYGQAVYVICPYRSEE